jgi:colanic acid biosynthesis protein WcaH
VWNTSLQLLLGQRVNPPAKSYWFVPGGRIRKDETLAKAFHRLSQNELGKSFELEPTQFIGVYEHFYSENFAERAGISTHYVVLAYQIFLTQNPAHLPREQHHAYRWMSRAEILADPWVHQYTKDYFLKPNQLKGDQSIG